MQTILQSNIMSFAKSREGKVVGYLKDLLLGQLAKFDLFNDISFILSSYYCNMGPIALIALVISSYNVSFKMYDLSRFILMQCFQSRSTAKLLSTKFINDFFNISIIGRNMALTSLLDDVAPYNVTVIRNNPITRIFLPNIAGRSISNSVKVMS
jgi:hypothetical protein